MKKRQRSDDEVERVLFSDADEVESADRPVKKKEEANVTFIPEIQELIDLEGINGRDVNFFTPLHLAAKDQPDAIPRLIELGADVNSVIVDPDEIEDDTPNISYTPLHIAVEFKNIDAVRKLIDAGADVNSVIDYVDDAGFGDQTPLHLAVYNQPEAIPLLFEAGANVNARDGVGDTPLHYAAISQPDAIPILIKLGSDVNARDVTGWTPLHYAAQHQPEAIPHLLDAGAKVNVQDTDGWTPLHHAAQRQPEAIPILIKLGADVNARDKTGWTPLHVAAVDQPEAIPHLLEAGAKVNARTHKNKTAFDLCKNDKCKQYLFMKHFQKMMLGKRVAYEHGPRGGLPRLPELPVDVWEYILHKKMHKELCEHLQNETNRRKLFQFARKMQVPQEMLDKWNQLPKREICEQLAKMLSIGAFYSEKGMEFLLRREQMQKKIGLVEQFCNDAKQMGISLEGKTIVEILTGLKKKIE